MADEKKNVALKMVVDGKVREITFEELAISNNMSQEALVRLLVRKNVFDPKEFMEEMQNVQKERYRGGEPEK